MTDQSNSTRFPRKQEGPDAKAIQAVRAPEPIAAPTKPERPPQTIRGGYLIVRRKAGLGFLKRIAKLPFEHGCLEEAEAQAAVLANRHRDEFSVFAQVATALPQEKQEVPTVLLQQAPAAEPIAPAKRRPVVVERRTSRAVKQAGGA